MQSLDAYDTFFVATLWLPVLVSAFATLLLKAVPRGAGAQHLARVPDRTAAPAAAVPAPVVLLPLWMHLTDMCLSHACSPPRLPGPETTGNERCNAATLRCLICMFYCQPNPAYFPVGTAVPGFSSCTLPLQSSNPCRAAPMPAPAACRLGACWPGRRPPAAFSPGGVAA